MCNPTKRLHNNVHGTVGNLMKCGVIEVISAPKARCATARRPPTIERPPILAPAPKFQDDSIMHVLDSVFTGLKARDDEEAKTFCCEYHREPTAVRSRQAPSVWSWHKCPRLSEANDWL